LISSIEEWAMRKLYEAPSEQGLFSEHDLTLRRVAKERERSMRMSKGWAFRRVKGVESGGAPIEGGFRARVRVEQGLADVHWELVVEKWRWV
jgi:hypothetical protein